MALFAGPSGVSETLAADLLANDLWLDLYRVDLSQVVSKHSFQVQFPFPDEAQRAEIRRRVYPPTVPTEGLDVARLARLGVAGGTIRNIALGAAFLASDAGESVRMAHLLAAARAEYARLDKSAAKVEVIG